MAASMEAYVALSAVLFAVGGLGVLVRRSPLVTLMSIEVMWGSAGLAFLAFAREWGNVAGHAATFMMMVIAAAEAAIGLALIVLLFRDRQEADVDHIRLLRG